MNKFVRLCLLIGIILISNNRQLCLGQKDEMCPLNGTQWSSYQQRCVALVDTSCSEVLACTENAFCTLTWTCQCKNGFSSNSLGQCHSSFGEVCFEDGNLTTIFQQGISATCNQDEFLRCLNSKCVCQQGRHWDQPNGRCFSLVGGKCDLKLTTYMFQVSFCGPSASCIPSSHHDLTEMRHGICQCDPDSQETQLGTCLLTNSATTDSHPIMNNLISNIFYTFLFTYILN